MSEEIWKDVVGYEGLYQVSSKGRIKGLERTTNNTNIPEKILSQRVEPNGNISVQLTKDGRQIRKYVQYYVANAFLKNKNGYTRVIHKDENKQNNCVDNLIWVDDRYDKMFPNEQWRAINGYEGLYEISTYGRVYGLPKPTTQGKILKSSINSNGYPWVNLCKNGTQKAHRIHRLVAEAFIPNDNPSIKTDVNHKDGNKLNNTIDNLEWCSRAYNIQHAFDTELRKDVKKVIRNDGIVFDSESKAAKAIGTHQSNISAVCRGVKKSIKGYTFEFYYDE